MGVDPGTQKMGVAIATLEEEPKVIYIKTIHLKGKELSKRLFYQFEVLRYLLETYTPRALVCEQAFVHKNVQSSLLLGQSRGAIMVAAESHKCKFVEYTPAQIKKRVTGVGNASKTQIQEMIGRLFELTKTPSEDAADALAMCFCYIQEKSARRPREQSL